MSESASDSADKPMSADSKREWNKMRAARKKMLRNGQKQLLSRLDAALPDESRRLVGKGQGKRSLGSEGRSLLNILEDTVDYLRRCQREEQNRARAMREVGGVARDTSVHELMRPGLLSSRSLVAFEVDLVTLRVRAVSSLVEELYTNSDFGSPLGRSLRETIHPEDAHVLQQMKIQAQSTSGGGGYKIPVRFCTGFSVTDPRSTLSCDVQVTPCTADKRFLLVGEVQDAKKPSSMKFCEDVMVSESPTLVRAEDGIEVELPDGKITGMRGRTKDWFRHAPFKMITGQYLTMLLHPLDQESFILYLAELNRPKDANSARALGVRIVCFHPVNFLPRSRDERALHTVQQMTILEILQCKLQAQRVYRKNGMLHASLVFLDVVEVKKDGGKEGKGVPSLEDLTGPADVWMGIYHYDSQSSNVTLSELQREILKWDDDKHEDKGKEISFFGRIRQKVLSASMELQAAVTETAASFMHFHFGLGSCLLKEGGGGGGEGGGGGAGEGAGACRVTDTFRAHYRLKLPAFLGGFETNWRHIMEIPIDGSAVSLSSVEETQSIRVPLRYVHGSGFIAFMCRKDGQGNHMVYHSRMVLFDSNGGGVTATGQIISPHTGLPSIYCMRAKRIGGVEPALTDPRSEKYVERCQSFGASNSMNNYS
eukprot:764954-Hanusia_phi.AAC.2